MLFLLFPGMKLSSEMVGRDKALLFPAFLMKLPATCLMQAYELTSGDCFVPRNDVYNQVSPGFKTNKIFSVPSVANIF